MKLVTTAMVLEHHLISPDKEFECTGIFRIQNHVYRCSAPHGRVTLIQALGQSCNGYFAHLTPLIHIHELLRFARALGLASPTRQANLPDLPWAFPQHPQSPVQDYILGLAPDLQSSLFQLLRLSGLIATQGKLPHWQVPSDSPVIHPETWGFLANGMHLASRSGTGKHLDPKNHFHLAIKTGTTNHGYRYQSWISGFFPYHQPRYAICLRAPQGTSQDQAVPLLRQALHSRSWDFSL